MERVGWVGDGANSRAKLFGMSLRAIEERPYLGVGYGVYEEIIPAFADDKTYHYIRSAHNTYLENAVELGLIGASALFLSISALVAICLKSAFDKSVDSIYPLIGLGVTTIVAVHSLVDFPLQMPAVALTYAAVMGASCAHSLRSVVKKGSDVRPRQRIRRKRVDDLPTNRF